MSHSPQEPPSNRSPLDFDELLAVVISLFTVGLILLFGLSRRGTRFSLTEGFQTQPSIEADSAETGLSLRERELADEDLSDLDIDDPAVVGAVEGDRPTNLFPTRLRSLGRQAELDELETEAEEVAPRSAVNRPAVVVPTPSDRTPPPLPAQTNAVEREVSEPLEFSDVASDYWAEPFIDRLSSRQIISGFTNGTFRPEQPVTRAELAAQLTKAFAMSSSQETINFTDISEDYWAAQSIDQTVKAGFMEGYPDNEFQPEQSIPRVQVLVAIASGLGLTAPEDAESILASTFSDADAIPEWAVDQIAAATEAGLVVSHPDASQLNPNQDASRAEVAAILSQALVYLGELENISSPYVVQP
ncbi:S-layer homology domain-containing protein [Sphaerothrix gracilis]|uniref:S-layer homology domain-containing protein n=1 Tax=Sphaerothrix gracilis TaxID=3151835 RepID=UPI0031FC1D9E